MHGANKSKIYVYIFEMCLMLKSPICIKYMYIYIAPVDLEEGGGVTHTRNLQNYEKGKSFHLRALSNEISMKS